MHTVYSKVELTVKPGCIFTTMLNVHTSESKQHLSFRYSIYPHAYMVSQLKYAPLKISDSLKKMMKSINFNLKGYQILSPFQSHFHIPVTATLSKNLNSRSD